MKNIIITSAILASALASKVSAQDTELFTIKLKENVVPIEVISKVKSDFLDGKSIVYKALPLELVGETWVVKENLNIDPNQKFDAYQVNLMGKDEKIMAMYDKDGKLISYRSKMKDVALPIEIDKTIVETYPGWHFAKNSESITLKRNGKKSIFYNIEIKKGKEKLHLLFDENYNLSKTSKI
ncbi:hypothetical protein EGI22_18380 [Lacihabitans sp. LS3-19]|uniref:hypothetical protein n=1 Tax=Lacihabitans sp. LS3-19 TaxID=2487335 RepID=UPI0020CC740B|nr:hypothetical protein [Lacihabitans sp. LS3-19]MCP9769876.1 hypothetical protein [Lacihabitans sp. LS3-19]